MKAYDKLKNKESENNSIVCVGLDIVIDKMPSHISKDMDGMLQFNKAIIDNTKDLVSSYKVNFAFYEQYGIQGMKLLKETIDYIPEDIHVIGDAKRGDIGNTSKAYAKAVFEEFNCDSITVSPYMGSDSINPFLSYNEKMVFLLCLTSNPGSKDFEKLKAGEQHLYEKVLNKSSEWADSEQLGYVVGATHSSELKNVREQAPDRYFLIPGVGAQGGNPAEVVKSNLNGPAIINSSRGIIYAGGDSKEFADYSRKSALDLRNKLNEAKS